jgi:hypothetical protein
VLVKHAVEDKGVLLNVLRQIDLLPRQSRLLQFSDYQLSALAFCDVHVIIADFLLAQRPLPDDYVDFGQARHAVLF